MSMFGIPQAKQVESFVFSNQPWGQNYIPSLSNSNQDSMKSWPQQQLIQPLNSQVQKEIQIPQVRAKPIDSEIDAIEEKQRLIRQQQKNKKPISNIDAEGEEILQKFPGLKRVNNRFQSVFQQTEQFLQLINGKEENYVFEVAVDEVLNQVKNLCKVVQYGNSTSHFCKDVLSDIGAFSRSTTSQLEQYQLETQRIQKSMNQIVEKNIGSSSQKKLDQQDAEESAKRILNVKTKLNKIEDILKQFNSNLSEATKDVQPMSDLIKQLDVLNVIKLDTQFQCLDQSLLVSKIEKIESSKGQYSEQDAQSCYDKLKKMIQFKIQYLDSLMDDIGIRLAKKKIKIPKKGKSADVDFDLDDIEDEPKQQTIVPASEHSLMHFSSLQNQKNGQTFNKKFQGIQYTGDLDVLVEKMEIKNKQKKDKLKTISLDLEEQSSEDSEKEEVPALLAKSLINPSLQASSFRQCQSLQLGQTLKLNTSQQLNQSVQSSLLDQDFYKGLNVIAPVSKKHNIKQRQNLFESLKASQQISQSNQGGDGQKKEGEIKNTRIIQQSVLTPLQYETLGKEVISKEKIQQQQQQQIGAVQSQIKVGTTTAPNIMQQQQQQQLQQQQPPSLIPKQKGGNDIGRMAVSIHGGQKEREGNNKLEVNTLINRTTSQFGNIELDMQNIRNPIATDSDEFDEDGDEYDDDDDDEGEEDDVPNMLGNQGAESTLGRVFLDKKGVSMNLGSSTIMPPQNNQQKAGGLLQTPATTQAPATQKSQQSANTGLLQTTAKPSTNQLPTTGLGLTATANKPQGQNAPQSGGLFAGQPSTTGSLFGNLNDTKNPPQKDTKIQQSNKAAIPPSSPSQAQVKEQAQKGLFGQTAANTQAQETKPKQVVAAQPPSSPPANKVKEQAQKGLFGVSTQQNPNEKAKQQSAALPPSSPPAEKVKQQASLGLFGQPSKVEEKKSAVPSLGLGQTTQGQQIKAAQPPSSPTQEQVTKQTQSNLFGQKPTNVDTKTKPLAAGIPPSSPSQSQVKEQASKGLFGQAPVTQGTTQITGGLFGKTGTTATATATASQSLMNFSLGDTNKTGDNATNQTTSKPTPPPAAGEKPTGGLFGTANANTLSSTSVGLKPAPAPTVADQQENKGLFGNPLAQPSQTGGGLFGKPAPAPTAVDQQPKQPENKGFLGNAQTSGGLFNTTQTNPMFGQQNNQQSTLLATTQNQPNSQDNQFNGDGPKKKRQSIEDKSIVGLNNNLGSLNFGAPQNTNQQTSNMFNFGNQQNQPKTNTAAPSAFGGGLNAFAPQPNTNNNQMTGLNGLNFGQTQPASGGLFGTTNQSQNAPAFGNANALFGNNNNNANNNNNNTNNMFGFAKPQGQMGGLPQAGFGSGNSTFVMGNNAPQQNQNAFKSDLTKINFGFGNASQPQQQQQQQQQQQSGNMFSGFVGQQQQGGMFGQSNAPSFNLPQGNNTGAATGSFNKMRK